MINEKLFKAVETGKIDEVEKVLTVEKINTTSYYGIKSIVLAVEKENLNILEILLKNGERINRESFWRRTAFSALRAAKDANNTKIFELLLEHGAGLDKKRLAKALTKETYTSPSKLKFCYEDGICLPEKSTKDYQFVQYVKEGKNKKINDLLEDGVSEKALLSAVDAALEKNNWEAAVILSEYCYEREIEIYTECIKKLFIKSSYIGDTEKVKLFLEKLIENAVGVLSDETGKSTLEIALENSPTDLIKILSNYGFHENSLQHAYKCLSNTKRKN